MGKKYYEDPKGMRTARKVMIAIWGGAALMMGWLLVGKPPWQRLSMESVALGLFGGVVTAEVYNVFLRSRVLVNSKRAYKTFTALTFFALHVLAQFLLYCWLTERNVIPAVSWQELIWVALVWLFSETALATKVISQFIPVVEEKQRHQELQRLR